MTQKDCLTKIHKICKDYLKVDSSAEIIKEIATLTADTRVLNKDTRVMYKTKDGRFFDSILAVINASTALFEENHLSFEVYPKAEVTGNTLTPGSQPPVNVCLDQWTLTGLLFTVIRGLRTGELLPADVAFMQAAEDMQALKIFKEYPTDKDVLFKYINSAGLTASIYEMIDFRREADAVLKNLSFDVFVDAPTVPSLVMECFGYMRKYLTMYQDKFTPSNLMPRNCGEVCSEAKKIITEIDDLSEEIHRSVCSMLEE